MTLISENIRYLRKLNGLTQEQFSRKINIKRSLLGAYEEGRANPNQQNTQAIAKAFNTTVELLTRQDLRKLRETPSLSIPLGQGGRTADSRTRHDQDEGPVIRSDGAIDPGEDDPFQHPDFPDIFAPPSLSSVVKKPDASQAEPKPLSAVLNSFYRAPEPTGNSTSRAAPVPPVITPPVRPENERTQPVRSGTPVFQPVSNQSPVDRLFSPQPSNRQPDRSVDERHSNPPAPVRQSDSRPADSFAFGQPTDNPGPVSRSNTASSSTSPSIPVVMSGQFAEYSQRFQQAEFLHRLPAMHLPTLPDGNYRAFEAGDDFAFPGALLVGQSVRNWFDIADGKMYVLLLQPDRSDRSESGQSGLCCRRVYNQIKIKGTLLLTADKADVPNRDVSVKDLLEVWEIRAFVSQQLPPPTPNTERLRQLVDDLRFEVERL